MLILVQRHPFYFQFLTSSYPHNNGPSLNVQILIYISNVLGTGRNHKVVENSSAVNISRINLVSTNVQTMLNVVSFLVSTLGNFFGGFVAASTTFPSILLRQHKSERGEIAKYSFSDNNRHH